ncbi:Serine/threonine protein kinase [Handroanthus impetiginosus]|uniref:Serine/threonine protein kinase n=1 Tax=Handroanthus impetiginosus TaxID=429701 RepID=A0A2G9H6R8_9LAMI|nr:Serine/threonine protein kinase [Handroanthus impetiginosus]
MPMQWFYLIAIVCLKILGLQVLAVTDGSDVQGLQDLYRSLNSPMQLQHWKSEGGDPCGEAWIGVQCSGSSIINLKLHGLGLTGNLGYQLSNLRSLKHLDLSSNHIEGSIPYNLPPNITNLNLAANRLSQSIPYSLENMKHLRHLNLSHNQLSGSLGDVFKGLENLREMDLSFNNFTGDLPISVTSLTNLTSLFLQGNQFTGSVIFLANLSLSDLNIEDNHFSGVIPEKFQTIPNLWIGGNKFDRNTNYPPWNFPSETTPKEKNISSPPATNLSAFESHPSQIRTHNKKKSHAAGIVIIIGGVALVAACAAFAIVVHRRLSRGKTLRSLASGDEESMTSPPISTVQGATYTSMSPQQSPHLSAFSSSPMITPSRLPAIRTKTIKVPRRKSLSKSRMPISAKAYTVAELQIATNSFSEENLVGEGSLGSVYRAEFPDGTILAVKNIKTVPLSIIEEQQFFDVIRNASRLRHPNIVTLLGYCMEHCQHLVMYEFIKNLSLDEALHSATYKPLPWGRRLHIALGIARALDYIHSSCVPPIAHSNLKAANILLDEELMPRVCDSGLAVLRPLASNTVKLKASEMAIADSGYIAPENDAPGIGNTKADVYAFGVLLLELLTGRKPFDNLRPKAEQCLATWASSKLYDSASLGQMVDPAIKRTIPSKSLSHFADIVSMCIQPEQEFRPPMSDIVESLMRLLQKPNATDGAEALSFDPSFRSTNSRFLGSPTLSFYSL